MDHGQSLSTIQALKLVSHSLQYKVQLDVRIAHPGLSPGPINRRLRRRAQELVFTHSKCGVVDVKGLNKTTLSLSRQARHRRGLARASTNTGTRKERKHTAGSHHTGILRGGVWSVELAVAHPWAGLPLPISLRSLPSPILAATFMPPRDLSSHSRRCLVSFFERKRAMTCEC